MIIHNDRLVTGSVQAGIQLAIPVAFYMCGKLIISKLPSSFVHPSLKRLAEVTQSLWFSAGLQVISIVSRINKEERTWYTTVIDMGSISCVGSLIIRKQMRPWSGFAILGVQLAIANIDRVSHLISLIPANEDPITLEKEFPTIAKLALAAFDLNCGIIFIEEKPLYFELRKCITSFPPSRIVELPNSDHEASVSGVSRLPPKADERAKNYRQARLDAEIQFIAENQAITEITKKRALTSEDLNAEFRAKCPIAASLVDTLSTRSNSVCSDVSGSDDSTVSNGSESNTSTINPFTSDWSDEDSQ